MVYLQEHSFICLCAVAEVHMECESVENTEPSAESPDSQELPSEALNQEHTEGQCSFTLLSIINNY